jgi:hypothetical protein
MASSTLKKMRSPDLTMPKSTAWECYCMRKKNQNLFPTNLRLPYLKEVGRTPSGTNQFEILYQGSFLQLTNPASIVIRSEPWQGKSQKWTRVYGFADGHCEVHSEPDGNFDAWEKRHLRAAPKSGHLR